jgi:hypothetical protein
MESNEEARLRCEAIADVKKCLLGYADPIPRQQDFINGIDHKNNNPRNSGQMWDVVRALHSRKMHYWSKLIKVIEQTPDLKFCEAHPHLSPASGGTQRMGDRTWQSLKKEMGLQSKADYVKHMLTMHDGEVRLVGAEDFYIALEEFAPGESLYHPCFWNYQFATHAETRQWLYQRSEEHRQQDQCLTRRDVEWMMQKEKNKTSLMKKNPNPASGGESWYIRSGHMLTLAELFHFAMHRLTCFDLYQIYLSLPIFIHKRVHQVSHSEEGTVRRNAKALRYHQTGRWGLPSR